MIIAEETTTLPEGVTLSVIKDSHTKTGTVGTYLTACGAHTSQIRMRVDDIAPGSLRQYLELIVRQIRKYRDMLTAQPTNPHPSPDTIRAFVHQMAWNGMFVFEVLNHATDLNGNPPVPKSRRKVSRKAKRKNHKQDS